MTANRRVQSPKMINNNKAKIDLVRGLPSFAVGNRKEAIFCASVLKKIVNLGERAWNDKRNNRTIRN
ncbi:hypothetical protein TNCV_3960641 [Trichonephila clavipes]|nr:hypothetical protein TNCV_3960641 [Trichonephila clavipes]